jgi:hypothetical protein
MAGMWVVWTSTVGARWRSTQRRSEPCGMNLNDGHAGGVDLDGEHAVETHVEEERGSGVEVHAEDAEEERAPVGVWWGNEKIRV